jgi:hypothetical protein
MTRVQANPAVESPRGSAIIIPIIPRMGLEYEEARTAFNLPSHAGRELE